MKRRSCGLVRRIGFVDSASPLLRPSGGQAPRLAKSSTALHFLVPPSAMGLQLGRFRRWRAGIEVDWRACFYSNRSCRLAPARQGLKGWSCGVVQRIGTADSAAPLLRPSGGQAPALHFSVDHEMPNASSARVADAARPLRRPSRIRIRDMLSCQWRIMGRFCRRGPFAYQ